MFTNRTTTRIVLTLALVLIGTTALVAKKDHVANAPMDDGRLEPSWFGEGLAFREADEIDYLWVAPGFSIEGRSFHFVGWPEPELIGESANDRDENDRRLARQMNADMAKSFADILGREWGGAATTSLDSGDVRVEGRIVDCSTGSAAAKAFVGFGAGSGNTTIDLKFVDAQSGELLVAIHHRVVSGTNWSTTDSKFFKWIEELGENTRKKGFARLYEKGDPRKK